MFVGKESDPGCPGQCGLAHIGYKDFCSFLPLAIQYSMMFSHRKPPWVGTLNLSIGGQPSSSG